MTNAAAQTARRAVFTAFGELVMADDGHGQPPAVSRYGYAGAWGYETALDDAGEPDLPPLPFIHVGERWYDPSSGRFLQRDPIGIRGGLNTFNYLHANPASGVDPKGLFNDLAFGPLLPPNWQPGGLTSLPTPPPPPVGPPWPLPPEPGPAPRGNPAAELIRLDKEYNVCATGLAVAGVVLSIGAPPIGAAIWLGIIGASLIDEIWNWDEPVNPIY